MESRLLLRLVVSTVFIIASTEAEYADTVGHLTANLLQSYTTIVKPSKNLTVTIGFSLLYLDYNDQTSVLTSRYYQYLAWQDERLAWSSDDYEGVDSLSMPSDHIWTPDITLYNGIESPDKEDKEAVVGSDGDVYWVIPVTYKTFCQPESNSNKSRFSNLLNTITCKLVFGSWAYSGSEMKLESNWGVTFRYSSIRDYILINVDGQVDETKYDCCPEPYYNYSLNITIAPQARTSLSRFKSSRRP